MNRRARADPPRRLSGTAITLVLALLASITLARPVMAATIAPHWRAAASNLRGAPDCVAADVCLGVAGDEIVTDRHVATSTTWTPVFTTPVSASERTDFVAVSCSLPGCVAIGNRHSTQNPRSNVGPVAAVSADRGKHWRLVALPIARGVSAQSVGVRAVSCGTATDCVILGSAKAASLAWSTSDGGRSWNTVNLPRGAAEAGLTAIDCTSATFCVAGGNGVVLVTTTGSAGFAVARTPATWDLHTSSANYASTIAGITCIAHTRDCVAVGYREITETFSGNMTALPSRAPRPLIASSTGGRTWTEAGSIPAAPGSLTAVACPAAGTCIAGGYAPTTSGAVGPTELIVSDGGTGRWRAVAVPRPSGNTLLGIDGIACTSRLCIAGGATASLKVSTARYELLGPA